MASPALNTFIRHYCYKLYNIYILYKYYITVTAAKKAGRVPTRCLPEGQWGEPGFHGLPVAVHAGERQAVKLGRGE
ncbi:MAG: hypothetical protein ACRETE_09420, partial [Stenotrophobium sp.]